LADLGERWRTAQFVVGLAVRDCTHTLVQHGGVIRAWFVSLSDKSWGCAEFRPNMPPRAYQNGLRRLVENVEAALLGHVPWRGVVVVG